jgi:hypothetical protein
MSVTMRVAIVERESCWAVDYPEGPILGGLHDTAADALRRVRDDAERYSRNRGVDVVTVVEWESTTKIGGQVVRALQ